MRHRWNPIRATNGSGTASGYVTRGGDDLKILVTGATGMLGKDLCALAAERGHQVFGTDVERLALDPRDRLDVTDAAAVRRAIGEMAPDIVLHLAAVTDVDGCEANPENCFCVNVLGTKNLALAAMESDIPLLYVSTGSVFDGTKSTPYHEFETPNPISVYSQSKYAGEVLVRTHVPHHIIVRAGWMFVGGREDKKFVAKMVQLASERDEIQAVDDKFGSPCYTVDFATRCLDLAEGRAWGTFHAPNEGWCSRFEMAQAIVEFAGLENCRVRPCNSATFPLAAPRPRLEALENLHCRLMGMSAQPHWRQSLESYVRSIL